MFALLAIIAALFAILAAPPRSERYQTPIVANVLDYGAIGDGVTDDSQAFADAFAAAAERGVAVHIPHKIFRLARQLDIRSAMVIRSDGAILLHSVEGVPLLSAREVDDWTIQGPLTLVGTKTNPGQTGNQIGLRIHGCNRYVVDKLTVRSFKGVGVDIGGGSPMDGTRGDEGRFAFLSFIDNNVGLRIHDGAAAEYTLFTLLSFTKNDLAADIAAGNTIISTSNVVDNADGLRLSSGVNDGHGIVSASNISHNRGFNVEARGIDNGYTFNASHLYSNSANSGVIRLINSRGILFNGGVLSSAVISKGEGTNAAVSNLAPGNVFNISGADSQRFKLLFNFDEQGLPIDMHGRMPESSDD